MLQETKFANTSRSSNDFVACQMIGIEIMQKSLPVSFRKALDLFQPVFFTFSLPRKGEGVKSLLLTEQIEKMILKFKSSDG